MGKNFYRCIGIMTGNSLDAVDTVITEFSDSQMSDLCGHSLEIPPQIAEGFRTLKQQLADNNGDIKALAEKTEFKQLHEAYIKITAKTVNQLLEKAKLKPSDIDAIGFHGQTCAHCPPSIAKGHNNTYTLQIGSGQMLADLAGIPVIFDFRSDDLMNGGEAAPLAPVHNQHIACDLRAKGLFPIAFCNGGNTGNIAVISINTATGKECVRGWDTGPFNHFIDYLVRTEKNEPCDFDGKFGKHGKINYTLLKELFEQAVVNQNGNNFLLQAPPKSSDPAWYQIIPSLSDSQIPFADRLRTAEFFSAYIFVYNLHYIAQTLQKPNHFLVFGGGWKNPLIFQDFKDLLHGKAQVLPQHQKIFAQIVNPQATVDWSDKHGYNGQFMEARIFADMAKCYLCKEPFSYPETTGCKTPTIGGIMAVPGGNNLQLYSRAARGWRHNA